MPGVCTADICMQASQSVRAFLTALQLLPLRTQQAVLSAFISKIEREDDARASQLEGTSVRVVAETVVAQNPKNDAEKVTVTEIECDHACTWEHALRLAGEPSSWHAASFSGFWSPRHAQWDVFLVLPHDAHRCKIVYPMRVSGGLVSIARLLETMPPGSRDPRNRNFVKWVPLFGGDDGQALDPRFIPALQKMWEDRLQMARSAGANLERFALLNGSVFSIWYNVRKAMDPAYQPRHETRESMEMEANGSGRGRGGRAKGYAFQPSIKIQLITTSDGKKIGGIRLSAVRPLLHRGKPFVKDCNKLRVRNPEAANWTFCRKRACMVEGLNEVDKLKSSLATYARDLN